MRAARFMKWGGGPVAGAATLASFMIGVGTVWYLGVIIFVILYGGLLVLVMALLVVLVRPSLGRYGGPLPKDGDGGVCLPEMPMDIGLGIERRYEADAG